jgi:hypothetical protein
MHFSPTTGCAVLCAFLLNPNVFGATLFSGNFVKIPAGASRVSFGVNYPKAGPAEICGVEIKANAIVLNQRAWEQSAAAILAAEQLDDAPAQALTAAVERSYSPRLFYRFTRFDAAYGVITLQTVGGSKTLREVFAEALQTKPEATAIVAVAAACPL